MLGGSQKIFEKYKDWGSSLFEKTSSLVDYFPSTDTSKFRSGGEFIFGKWNQWYRDAKGTYDPIKKVIVTVWNYVSDWAKMKSLIKMIPMFLLALLSIFDRISSLFRKEVMKEDSKKEEQDRKAEEAKKMIQQVQQMVQENKVKSVWQSLWTLMSENTNVIPTLEFSHVSEIFDMSMNNSQKFMKKVDELKKLTNGDSLGHIWGKYKDSKSMILSLKHEGFLNFILDSVNAGIGKITDCRPYQQCKQEENLKEVTKLIFEKQREVVSAIFNLFS